MDMRKRLLLAGIAVMLIAMMTGGALAYLNDTDSQTDTITLADGLTIQLQQPHWDGANLKNVKPRQIIARDPQVKNLSSFDVYAFLEVIVPYFEDLQLQDYTGALIEGKGGALYTFETNPGWKQVIAPELTRQTDGSAVMSCVYAWMRDDMLTPLGSGQTTAALFDAIEVQNFVDTGIGGRPQALSVRAYAIDASINQEDDPTAPTTPLSIWNLLRNTYSHPAPAASASPAP